MTENTENETNNQQALASGPVERMDEKQFQAGEATGNADLVEQVRVAQEGERSVRLGAVKYLAIALAISVMGNVAMVYGFATTPKKIPIATTAEGAATICEIPRVDTPFIGTPTVQDFAREAIVELGSFDSLNWQTQINNAAARYLTNEFRNQYLQAFEGSKVLAQVLEFGAMAQMQSAGRVQVLAAGSGPSGAYEWQVQVPIDLYVKAGQRTQPRVPYVADMRVRQIPPNPGNPRGLAIDSISIAARVESNQK